MRQRIEWKKQMQSKRTITLSVVVSFHNKAHYIDDFLATLREMTPEVEFVLVDDGSTDGSGDIARRYADVLLRCENVWETKANNAGLKAASGDYVAIVQDDDLPVSPNWLGNIASIMESLDFGIIGGRGTGLDYIQEEKPESRTLTHTQEFKGYRFEEFIAATPAKHIQRHEVKLVTDDRKHYKLWEQSISSKVYTEMRGIQYAPRPIFLADTAIRSPLVIKKEVLQELDYLDESFAPLLFDDMDLAMRSRRLGIKVGTTTLPQITRFRSGSASLYTSPTLKEFFKKAYSKNNKLFLERHIDHMATQVRRKLSQRIVASFQP